ncbi:MAG: DUF2283 domain-containing protein [candidate division KSB1 bacterium]
MQPGVILDYDKNGRVVGIEMLKLSARVKPKTLKTLKFETV